MEQAERKPRPVRYFFTTAAKGTSSLLRLCMKNLPGWKEEKNPTIQHAADELWADEKQPRCIIWVDKRDRRGRIVLQSIDLSTGIQSRLDGMKFAANKSDAERAFALCRDIGLLSFGVSERSFVPRTWLLPEQRADFEEHVRDRRLEAASRGQPVPTYIVKPSGGSEGIGIFLLQHERQVPMYRVATAPLVAQDYISPMLLHGKKFDFRLYVLIRSVDPLEVYLHREGLARFCTEDYQEPSDKNLDRSYMHLANYSLNKKSEAFVRPRKQAGEEAGDNDDDDDDDDEDDDEDSESGGSGAHTSYAGCSKRPVSEVMKELESVGLIRESMLWMKIEKLVALTTIAMQPELALRYRERFPRVWPFANAAEAAAASEAATAAASNADESGGASPAPASRRQSIDRSRNAYHVVGFDVLLDDKGWPRLLEVNSKPSQAVSEAAEDGSGEKETSQIDLEVKQRVMSDVLWFVAGGERSPALRPIVGEDARRKQMPASADLLDRTRRVFDVLTSKKPVFGATSGSTSHSDRELSNSKFTTFVRSSGVQELVPIGDVQLAFARMCRCQEESRDWRFRSYQNHGPSPRGGNPTANLRAPGATLDFRPREQAHRMRFPAFARVLCELADLAYAGWCGPLAPGVSLRAMRLECLLEHIANYPKSLHIETPHHFRAIGNLRPSSVNTSAANWPPLLTPTPPPPMAAPPAMAQPCLADLDTSPSMPRQPLERAKYAECLTDRIFAPSVLAFGAAEHTRPCSPIVQQPRRPRTSVRESTRSRRLQTMPRQRFVQNSRIPWQTELHTLGTYLGSMKSRHEQDRLGVPLAVRTETDRLRLLYARERASLQGGYGTEAGQWAAANLLSDRR